MTASEFLSLSASFATVIAAAAVVVAAVIYNGQLKAMKKSRELESLLVIMDHVDNIGVRRTRFFMMEHGGAVSRLLQSPYTADIRRKIEERVRELSSGELGVDDIDLAVNGLNNISFLIREDYAPPLAVKSFMRNSLLHAWRAFEPYIKQRQSVSDGIAQSEQYGEHFEKVVKTLCA